MQREFTDSLGNPWDVWEVDPKDLERMAYDRRSTHRDVAEPPRSAMAGATATGVDSLSPDLRAGWLCFQRGTERRRFAPIPRNWHGLPESVLRVMLDVATPVAQTSDRAAHEPG